jgi:homoserine kinase
VMDDRLHQPYRLKMIPGGEEVFAAARKAGAMAVSLSGSGPSVIAYAPFESQASQMNDIAEAMVAAFAHANIQARSLVLTLTEQGCHIVSPEAAV